MTRLRVLKLFFNVLVHLVKIGFIHYDPFEGTETPLGTLLDC